MKNSTKTILAGISTVTTILTIPAVRDVVLQILAGHKTLSIIIAGIATIATTLHNPNTPAQS
jgi:hypothetical protein